MYITACVRNAKTIWYLHYIVIECLSLNYFPKYDGPTDVFQYLQRVLMESFG